MADALTATNVITVDEFFSQKNLNLLDQTLEEIFGMMLSCDVKAEALEVAAEWPSVMTPDEKTAVVGFAGSMRGTCSIRIGGKATLAVATAMMGGMAPEADDQASLCDAVGELCNMVAGGWKNRVSEQAALCSLAPPTVISGNHYNVHSALCMVAIGRSYSFQNHRLKLTLVLERDSS
jgi:chemotaxis protein CheX